MYGYKEDWQIPGHWFDYFEFFGVKENATSEEIKSAYIKLRKQYHPDVNMDSRAEENFKKVYIVYEVLSNPVKRLDYYNDYKKRKQNTNQSYCNSSSQTSNNKSQNKQTSSGQFNSDNQNNYQNTKTQNNNENMKFSDIVEKYKQDPRDKVTKMNLK